MAKYPGEFSVSARNRIEGERIQADEDFEKANPSKYPSDLRSGSGKLYQARILRVFSAFAKEACKLAWEGHWSIDQVESECKYFLRRLVDEVVRRPRKAGDPVREPAFEFALESWAEDEFGKGPDFAEYRRLLVGVAQANFPQSAPGSKVPDEPQVVEEGVKQRAERRRAFIIPRLQAKRPKPWSPGRLAAEAGVGKNSVYEYLNGKRAKISKENREAFSNALGVKPSELPD